MICPLHFCLLNACLVNNKTLIVKLRFVAEHCNDLVWSQKHGCNQKLMMILLFMILLYVLLVIHFIMCQDLALLLVVELVKFHDKKKACYDVTCEKCRQ